MIKRIDHFIKSYFIFSRTERRGVLWLLGLLLVIISLPYLYELAFPPAPIDFSITTLPLKSEEHAIGEESLQKHALFSFDPNTVNSDQLLQLGFPSHTAKTILNFRSKGGRFREPEDLGKIYGVTDSLYSQLEPYITIEKNLDKRAWARDSLPARKSVSAVVELNSADSVELVSLYRIGPALAHRIIEHRTRLGGFLNLNQLKEVWGFDEDILYDLKDKIRVDASRAKIHNLNSVSLDELKNHPYFKYKLSNAIINYRMQHGVYKSLADLKKLVMINDSIYDRITLYLKTD